MRCITNVPEFLPFEVHQFLYVASENLKFIT